MDLLAKPKIFMKTIFLLLSLSIWVSCTRPSSNQAKISLQLPSGTPSKKLGELSALSTLSHLVVNVTGPGMPGPFVFEWSADRPNDRCLDGVCSFEVLSGDSRLIQVLAIYEDSSGYGIYYADATKTLIAGSNTVDINLNPITTQSTITEVQLSGRYLTTSTTGPTGKLEVRYSPPGKPSMLLMGTEMYNGWFQVFGIKGIQFDYVFNGKSLMGGPIDPSIFDSKLGTHLLKMVWPSYYRQDGGSSSIFKKENGLHEYVGFFGPGLAGSEKICYGSAAGSITNSYKDTNKNPLNYSVSTSSTTDVYVAGGGVSGESNCTANFPNGTTFAYNPVASKEPLHFEGPFVRGSSGHLLDVTRGTATWDYLPKATADLEAMKLFVLNASAMDQFSIPMAHNMMNCSEINRRALANDPDIKVAGTVTASTKQLAIPEALNNLYSSPAAVLCPLLPGGVFMNSVARTWGGGEGGGSDGPYLRFEIMTNGSGGGENYKLNTNQCYEVHPTLYENGNRYVNNTTDPFIINGVKSFSSSIGIFYSDSNCLSPLASEPSIPASSSQTTVWFKPTTAGINKQFTGVTVSHSSGSTVNFEPAYNQFDVGNPRIILNVSPKLVQNECVGVTISLQDFGGQPLGPKTALTAALSQNSNWGLWNSSNCSTGSSLTFEANQSVNHAYIKLLSASGSFPLTNAVSISGYDFNPPTITASVGKNTVDAFKITFDESPLIRNRCVTGRVRLVNFDGGEVTTKTPIEIKLKLPQGAGVFYANGCYGQPIDSVMIPENSSSGIFYAHFYEVSTALNLEAQGSSLQLLNTPNGSVSQIPVAIQEDSDPWFLRLHPPSFNRAEIVGTHEFNDGGTINTYKKIPFEFGSGGSGASVSLQCFNGSVWNPCDAESVEQVNGQYFYKWKASDAVNNFTVRLKVLYSSSFGGTGERSVDISTSRLYGPKFRVITCSGIADGGTQQTIQAMVDNATASLFSTLCLPANVTYLRNAGESIKTLTVGGDIKNIIGHSSMTSVFDGNALMEPLIQLSYSLTADVTLANLKLRGLSANGVKGIFATDCSASSSVAFHINNIVIGDGGGISGIDASGIAVNYVSNSNITTHISDVKVVITDTASPMVTGIQIDESSYVNLDDIHISTGSNASTGISITTSYSSVAGIMINRAFIDGAGSGINVAAEAGYSISDFSLKNSAVHLMNKPNGNNSTATNNALSLSGYIHNSQITSNKFRADTGVNNQNLVGLYAPNNGEAPYIQHFSFNTFIQGSSTAPAFFGDTFSQTTSDITIQNFLGNSIAYVNPTASGTTAISATGSRFMLLQNGGGAFADAQLNRVCSNNANNNWTSTNSGGLQSDLFSFITLRFDDVDPLTGRCKTP